LGETLTDTLGAILEREPQGGALTPPVGIRRLLQRCVEKDSKRRLQRHRGCTD
jgi:hypothetical protein